MTHRLLLADDSVTIQRVVDLTFSGQDIEVIAVGDGEQAIARIPIERPDIVLADIAMPKRSGYDVSAFVKSHPDLDHVPVLLLAGAFEPVDKVRADEVRCDGVLVKPFEPHHVIARVRELLQRRRLTPPVPVAPVPVPVVDEVSSLLAPPSPRVEIEPAGEATGSADEYFGRLDAAFSARSGSRLRDIAREASDAWCRDDPGTDGDVPTVDGLLSQRPALRPFLEADHDRGAIAPLAATPTAAPAPPAITDELVDRVTERVLERLVAHETRDLVARIVSDVAERLVREEMSRVKSGPGRL